MENYFPMEPAVLEHKYSICHAVAEITYRAFWSPSEAEPDVKTI